MKSLTVLDPRAAFVDVGSEHMHVSVAQEETGLEGACEAWLDDWAPGQLCIAIALERSLREAIEGSARERKVRLTALRPWWVVALNAAAHDPEDDTRLLAVEEPKALTLICGGGGQFESVASYAPRPDARQTEALLTRALLSANVAATQGLRATLSTGAVPATSGTADMATNSPFAPRLERLA